jgi:hypothetical protein
MLEPGLVPRSSNSLELRLVLLQQHVEMLVILAHCGSGWVVVHDYSAAAPSTVLLPQVQGLGQLWLTPHALGYALQEEALLATHSSLEIVLEALGLEAGARSQEET